MIKLCMEKFVHLTNVYLLYLLYFQNWCIHWRYNGNQVEQSISFSVYSNMRDNEPIITIQCDDYIDKRNSGLTEHKGRRLQH